MPDIRDRLLKLNRKELEEEAEALGLRVIKSMSRAELITKIEQQYALQEFGELQAFSERHFLFAGLIFVTVATLILAIDTLFALQFSPAANPLDVILVPTYLVFRIIGGFLLAASLISIAMKTGHRSVTPIMRAACILGAVLIIIVVMTLIPWQWVP